MRALPAALFLLRVLFNCVQFMVREHSRGLHARSLYRYFETLIAPSDATRAPARYLFALVAITRDEGRAESARPIHEVSEILAPVWRNFPAAFTWAANMQATVATHRQKRS
jgi:hypothetical protein